MEATLKALMAAIQEGERVELRGFGTFKTRHIKSKLRSWRNPRDGKLYERRVMPSVQFRASKAFRKLLKEVLKSNGQSTNEV